MRAALVAPMAGVVAVIDATEVIELRDYDAAEIASEGITCVDLAARWGTQDDTGSTRRCALLAHAQGTLALVLGDSAHVRLIDWAKGMAPPEPLVQHLAALGIVRIMDCGDRLGWLVDVSALVDTGKR
jgi:hypothetical protein